MYFDEESEEYVWELNQEERKHIRDQLAPGWREENARHAAKLQTVIQQKQLQQRDDNQSGLQLFLTRTKAHKLTLIDAVAEDPGSSTESLRVLQRERGVDSSAIVFSMVLIPPSEADQIRMHLRSSNSVDEEVLEKIRGRSIVYVTPEENSWKMNESLATAMFGWPLDRTTSEPTRALVGWPNLNVPPIGHHPSLRVVVDSALKSQGTLWAVAGSTNTFVELLPDQLATLSSAEWGPSLAEFTA